MTSKGRANEAPYQDIVLPVSELLNYDHCKVAIKPWKIWSPTTWFVFQLTHNTPSSVADRFVDDLAEWQRGLRLQSGSNLWSLAEGNSFGNETQVTITDDHVGGAGGWALTHIIYDGGYIKSANISFTDKATVESWGGQKYSLSYDDQVNTDANIINGSLQSILMHEVGHVLGADDVSPSDWCIDGECFSLVFGNIACNTPEGVPTMSGGGTSTAPENSCLGVGRREVKGGAGDEMTLAQDLSCADLQFLYEAYAGRTDIIWDFRTFNYKHNIINIWFTCNASLWPRVNLYEGYPEADKSNRINSAPVQLQSAGECVYAFVPRSPNYDLHEFWIENASEGHEVAGPFFIKNTVRSRIQVSPNPVLGNGPVRIQLPDSYKSEGLIRIVNVSGRIVKDIRYLGNRSVVWDVTDNMGIPVGSGMYIVRTSSENTETGVQVLLIRR